MPRLRNNSRGNSPTYLSPIMRLTLYDIGKVAKSSTTCSGLNGGRTSRTASRMARSPCLCAMASVKPSAEPPYPSNVSHRLRPCSAMRLKWPDPNHMRREERLIGSCYWSILIFDSFLTNLVFHGQTARHAVAHHERAISRRRFSYRQEDLRFNAFILHGEFPKKTGPRVSLTPVEDLAAPHCVVALRERRARQNQKPIG